MYPSSLDNVQWTIIQAYLPKKQRVGKPHTHSYRAIFNAIFYVLRSGCPWRMLPKDFPPWSAVYYHFRKFKTQGLFKRICHQLRSRYRTKLGRNEEPTAAVIDSQSVKSIDQPGTRGYDGNKKVKGRKRHIVVDTEGLLLCCYVHEANIADCTGARELLLRVAEEGFMELDLVWADQGYRGSLLDCSPAPLHMW